jgi:hypothetical protein
MVWSFPSTQSYNFSFGLDLLLEVYMIPLFRTPGLKRKRSTHHIFLPGGTQITFYLENMSLLRFGMHFQNIFTGSVTLCFHNRRTFTVMLEKHVSTFLMLVTSNQIYKSGSLSTENYIQRNKSNVLRLYCCRNNVIISSSLSKPEVK